MTFRWEEGDWSACSVTCGSGVQTRPVECKQRISSDLTIVVNKRSCDRSSRPSASQACQDQPCADWLLGNWTAVSMVYSKTCVKRPLSKRPKVGFQSQLLLNAGQKYYRMLRGEHSATLLTLIKLPFVIKILFCLFLSGSFTQVLLYYHRLR